MMMALLDSASSDLIGVSNWWPRAESALEAAASASSWGEAVTVACRKLQIDTLTPESAASLTGLEAAIEPNLADWAEVVHAERQYLVALTKITRTARKNASKKDR